jgi:hypothetical protein
VIPFECKEIATCLDGFTNPPSYAQCVALGPTREDSIRLDFSKQKSGNKVRKAVAVSVYRQGACCLSERVTPAPSVVVETHHRGLVHQVRVEIGTQAGALIFYIAMEDVFMWSRKARQFLNKCRDFMAVDVDDVRPAGYAAHAPMPLLTLLPPGCTPRAS